MRTALRFIVVFDTDCVRGKGEERIINNINNADISSMRNNPSNMIKTHHTCTLSTKEGGRLVEWSVRGDMLANRAMRAPN